MGGLALSALALFCILLPGLVLQFRYYQKATKWDATGTVDIGSARSILLAVLFSLPIHAVWSVIVVWLDRGFYPVGQIDFATLVAIIQGNGIPNSSTLHEQLTGPLLWKINAYIWSQAVVAYFFGGILAKVAVLLKRDKSISLGSQGALWHRLFRYVSDNPDWIEVTVTVCLGNKTYLYNGILFKYELTADGSLRYLDLEGTSRKNIDGIGGDDDAYEMPGEHFIIDCKNVETLDIDYFYEDKAPQERPKIRIRETLKAATRMTFWEIKQRSIELINSAARRK